MAVNFNALLSKPMAEIKREAILPEGTYFGTIGQKYEFKESSRKKTPFVQFNLKPTHAADEVELADEEGQAIDVTKRNLTVDFYLSDAALPILKELIEGLGITADTLAEGVPQLVGQSVQFEIKHEIGESQSGEPTIRARVGRVSAVA